MSALTAADIVSLKSQLKAWEKAFRAREGRPPEKADMKADKEIAEKYAAYNIARAGGKTGPSKRPSSSTVPAGGSASSTSSKPQPPRTPGHSSRPRTKPSSEAVSGAAGPSNVTYANVNSPSKLRKLVAEHSPRKKPRAPTTASIANDPGFGDDVSGMNPFATTKGGTGSPSLFAGLAKEAERTKDTPRTKARRYLGGEGVSPLKRSIPRGGSIFDNGGHPDRLEGGSQPGRAFTKAPSKGLGGFLRSNSVTAQRDGDSLFTASQPAPSAHSQSLPPAVEMGEDDDDDVLGPSPFKPRAADSHALPNLALDFDEDGEVAGGSANGVFPLSPSKKATLVAKPDPFRSGSVAPFKGAVATNETRKASVPPAEKLETAASKKRGVLPTTKSAVVGGEKDEAFYAEADGSTKNKADAVEEGKKAKGKKAAAKAGREAEKGKVKKTGQDRPTKRQKTGKAAGAEAGEPHILGKAVNEDEGSDGGGESETSLSRLPAIPTTYDDDAVEAELDVYIFGSPGKGKGDFARKGKERLADEDAMEEDEEASRQKEAKGKGKGKAKAEGKGKSKAEVPPPPDLQERLAGRSKVVIGRYRPFPVVRKPRHREGEGQDDESADFSSLSEGEGVGIRALQEREALRESATSIGDDDEEGGDDIDVSENLLDLLSIRSGPSKTERLRALDDQERVRRLLGDKRREEEAEAERRKKMGAKGLQDLEDDVRDVPEEGDEDREGRQWGEEEFDDEGEGDDDWASEPDGWKDVEDGLLMDDLDADL